VRQTILGRDNSKNLGERESMKKTILAVTAIILILSIIISACSTSYNQSINIVRKPSEIPDENQQATSVETTENDEKPQDSGETSTSQNQDCNLNDTEATENMQSVTSNDHPENSVNRSQHENTCRNRYPPDGRIYWSPEPPYAYTPTYTPKEWTKIPIIPIGSD
jgi:cell division protein FtsL